MALSLIYSPKKYAKSQVLISNTPIPLVTFDTMITEEHRFSSRVTYYPVESGTIVSDHIINQPDVIALSGMVTDTPLNMLAPFNRSIAAFNVLLFLHERRAVVDVVTGIRVYKNMAITLLDVPRNMRTGQSLTFNIEFQKIVFDNTIQVLRDQGNVMAGIQDVTPRNIVAENTNIPFLQNDPPFSLKDQATTATNVGVQSLSSIPNAVLPNVISNIQDIHNLSAVFRGI